MPNKEKIDIVRLGVIWRKLISMMDETSQTLIRTSFSTVIRENNDLACVVSDPRGHLIAQSTDSIPSFIGTVPFTLRSMIRKYPPGSLHPGDVLITNDPWLGTGHLNDVSVAMPVYYKSRLIGFVANVAHHNDIGGTSNPYAREYFEEGLLIPIVKLVEGGKENEAVYEFYRYNVRSSDIGLGDLNAQLASLYTGAAKICNLLEEEGFEDLEDISGEIIGRSEAAMKQRIKELLPEGRYESEVYADGFEEPLRIKATIIVKDETVSVDYTGTSSQVDKAINSVMNYTYAYSAYALKCVLDPNMPNNDGSIHPIRVTAPEGSLVNPTRPAAVWGRHATGHYFPAVILNALSQAVPEKVMAESGSCPLWNTYFRTKSESGRDFVSVFFMNGGNGAYTTHDGAHTLSFPTNVSNTPIEMFENLMPLRVLKKELIPDSGGTGKYRGGCGQQITFQALSEQSIHVSFRNDRIKNPARGMLGGTMGQRGRILLNGVEIPGKNSFQLKKDDILTFFTPGGGGMFLPKERDSESVKKDLRNGIITPEYSKHHYGI